MKFSRRDRRLRSYIPGAILWISTVGAFVIAFVTLISPGTVIDVLENYRDSVQRIQDGVDSIAKDARVIADRSDNFAKEISDDPRRDLTNLNYKFARDEFERAIFNEDIDAVSLFCTAAPDNWFKVVDQRKILQVSSESSIHPMLKECAPFDMNSFCSLVNHDNFEYADDSSNRASVYSDYCGPNAFRDIDTRARARAEARDKKYRAIRQKIDGEKLAKCELKASEIRSVVSRDRVPYRNMFVYRSLVRDLRTFRPTVYDPTSNPLSVSECSRLGTDLDEVWSEATASNP